MTFAGEKKNKLVGIEYKWRKQIKIKRRNVLFLINSTFIL